VSAAINCISTEHVLLGLIRVEHGLAARLLGSIGADLEQTRTALEKRLVGRGQRQPPPGALPSTPRSKKAFELALKEAKSRRSVHVRSEHLLLGLAGFATAWPPGSWRNSALTTNPSAGASSGRRSRAPSAVEAAWTWRS
jgi:ATP-dependent Clp protease ATP-binding subunit ClpA